MELVETVVLQPYSWDDLGHARRLRGMASESNGSHPLIPTKHPRLNGGLERPGYQTVAWLAARDGVSMSDKASDLIREALELYEDRYFAERAQERMTTFVRSKALPHEQVWAHLKRHRKPC